MVINYFVMSKIVDLIENPENFGVFQDDGRLNIFVPTGTYSGERLKPIVAICGPMVDPIVLLRHVDEITKHVLDFQPEHELCECNSLARLPQCIVELVDVRNLPNPELLEPEFDVVTQNDARNQFALRLAEFIAAQSPLSANEPVVHEFIPKNDEINAIFDSTTFVNVAKKLRYFINRNQRLPVNGKFSSKRLFSRKILRR